MLIKELNHNTIDVFVGQGWDNWGRFKIANKPDGKQLFQIKGNRFSKEDLNALAKHYK